MINLDDDFYTAVDSFSQGRMTVKEVENTKKDNNEFIFNEI